MKLSKEKIAQLQRAMRKMQEDSKEGIEGERRLHALKCAEYEEVCMLEHVSTCHYVYGEGCSDIDWWID